MKKMTFLLFAICLTTLFLRGQSKEFLDLTFEDETDLLSEKSAQELKTFLLKKRTNSVFEIETFPSYSDVERKNRSQFLAERLEELNFKIEKIIHFQKAEHLYFDFKKIEHLDFLRLTVYSENSNSLSEKKEQKNTDDFQKFNHQTVIDSKVASTLKLKKGTIIDIPVNAFAYPDGRLYQGEVIFKTREVLDKTDAILANVTTNLSTGEFLESTGMINLAAETLEGVELILADNKSLKIDIPSEKNAAENGFEVFKGIQVDGKFDWLLDTVQITSKVRPITRAFKRKKFNKIEQDSIAAIRNEFIDEWKQKCSDRTIKRRLKYYRKYAKKRDRRIKKKRYMRTRTDRDYAKLSKAQILGKAKYGWKFSPPRNSRVISRNSFNARQLGWINIDKIFKRPRRQLQNVLVKNPEGKPVKLLFKSRFVALEGSYNEGFTYFSGIPKDEPFFILDVEPIGNNQVIFAISESIQGEQEIELEGYQILDKGLFEIKMRRMLADAKRFRSSSGAVFKTGS